MKWFLQFLSVGSALIYTLLVIIDNRIRDGTAENTIVSEAQSNQRRLSVWGPYLPNRSASLTTQPAHQQNEALAPKRFDDQPTSDNDGARIRKRPASLPITGGSFEPSVPLEGKEAIWFVVSRAARLHAGPSVSSRITHFYPVGSELKLVGYEQGWFLVSDPATLRQGWIYEKYYLEAIRGPGQMIATLQEPENPKQKVVNARKPTPHVRRAKKIGPRPAKKIQPSIASAPRYRYETVASILDKALRR